MLRSSHTKFSRRAYDRSLLTHRSSMMSQQGPSPRAPPTKGPRANHAWESRSRTSPRKPPPNHSNIFETNSHPASHKHPHSKQSKFYSPPQYHDILTGARRRAEEDEQKMDRVRHEHSLFRSMQLIGLLVFSVGIFTWAK